MTNAIALPRAAGPRYRAAAVNPFVPDFVLQNDAQGRAAGEFEGAALFVDISGFTPLCESLLAHGREGAEALVHALRFDFDPLIAAAHEAGGFITRVRGG